MAVDLQVVFPQQLIQLTAVSEVAGLTPRTLDVTGDDFRSVDEVDINGLSSPSVVVVSRRRLLAQVPPSLGLTRVTSVSVVSNKLAITNQSILRFRIGRTPSKVTGILRLVQKFLKILFTTPGRDIFAPRIGAGALRNIGTTFGTADGRNIVGDFVVAVRTTEKQMIAIQARDPAIPFDERLLAARVRSAQFIEAESSLVVSVEVTSQAGRSALANLAV